VRRLRHHGLSGEDLRAVLTADRDARAAMGCPTFPDLGPDDQQALRAEKVIGCLAVAEREAFGSVNGLMRFAAALMHKWSEGIHLVNSA
jgi:hypothetical protein